MPAKLPIETLILSRTQKFSLLNECFFWNKANLLMNIKWAALIEWFWRAVCLKMYFSGQGLGPLYVSTNQLCKCFKFLEVSHDSFKSIAKMAYLIIPYWKSTFSPVKRSISHSILRFLFLLMSLYFDIRI